jgi:hypothetical protein
MRMRILGLVLFAVATVACAGCEGGASGRCDAVYSRLEQQPEFKQAGFSRYGNELRAAFAETCSKLKEEDLKCLDAVKTADDFGKCPAGQEAFAVALDRAGSGK